jgi:RHS repeat-associated protein
VIGLADSTGAIKTSYNYSPFGKKQTTGTASSNPFAFTGREDDGTGYYYYQARYYNPDQKRFIAEDPLGFGGEDSNLQAYVGNNPVDFTDPFGSAPNYGYDPIDSTRSGIPGQAGNYAPKSNPGSRPAPIPMKLDDGRDGSVVHRIGGGSPENLTLSPAEMKLQPPGFSVLIGGTPQQAADQMRGAFPDATKLLEKAKIVGTADVAAIRAAGFDLLPCGSKKLPNHGRIIHPNGVNGFTPANLKRLSRAFVNTNGH